MLPPTAQTTRITRSGKSITYTLEVIQQPEQARACGSGAKSSADRRPIDPPPIVRLKLSDQAGTDLTFAHDANFFLFVTLEHHVPSASPSPPPVLTGQTVAGIAYLDRPHPAGYFIFPDLSVRNEGTYRLRFALFEDTKDPAEADPADTPATVARRLDLLSQPFVVFSAKKFPGLNESTKLSRIVAEQGCRVRIRRDIRMRRRDKHTGHRNALRDSASPDPESHSHVHQPHLRPSSPVRLSSLTPATPAHSFPPSAPIAIDSSRTSRFDGPPESYSAIPPTPVQQQTSSGQAPLASTPISVADSRPETANAYSYPHPHPHSHSHSAHQHPLAQEGRGKRRFSSAFDQVVGPLKQGAREGQITSQPQIQPQSVQMQAVSSGAASVVQSPGPGPASSSSTSSALTGLETMTMTFRRADGRISSRYVHKSVS